MSPAPTGLIDKNLQNAQTMASKPFAVSGEVPVPQPEDGVVQHQGGGYNGSGSPVPRGGQRYDGLDQRAIDADPAGFAKWEAQKASFEQAQTASAGQRSGQVDPNAAPGADVGKRLDIPTLKPGVANSSPNPIARPNGPPVMPGTGSGGGTTPNPAERPGGGTTPGPGAPGGGLIEREMVDPNVVKDPVTQEASKIAAAQGTVDPATMTVQGQLEKLLGNDSKLMQNARAKAMQEANSRGLINSTMAAQAGEQAVIETATPIAQADAGTYFQQQRDNLGAENTFGLADKNFENSQSLADFQQQAQRAAQAEGANQRLREGEQQYQNSNSMFERDNALKRELTQAQLQSQEKIATSQQEFQREAMKFDADTRKFLTNLEIDSRVKINEQAMGFNAYQSYTNAFAAIASAQMEPADKDRMLNNLATIYNGNPWMPVTIRTGQPGPGTTPPPGGTTPGPGGNTTNPPGTTPNPLARPSGTPTLPGAGTTTQPSGGQTDYSPGSESPGSSEAYNGKAGGGLINSVYQNSPGPQKNAPTNGKALKKPTQPEPWDGLSQVDMKGDSGVVDLDISKLAKNGFKGFQGSFISMGSDVTAAKNAKVIIRDASGKVVEQIDGVHSRPLPAILKNLDPNGKYQMEWSGAGERGLRAMGNGR